MPEVIFSDEEASKRLNAKRRKNYCFILVAPLVPSRFKTICAYYGFLASKETVVLRQRESETKIGFYQRS